MSKAVRVTISVDGELAHHVKILAAKLNRPISSIYQEGAEHMIQKYKEEADKIKF